MMPDSATHGASNLLPRLCFVHIPKTAGTSVRSFLAHLYGELSFAAYTTVDYCLASDADLARYRFFAGHSYQRDWCRLPGGTLLLTILRDPVERAISLYRYWNAIDIAYLEARVDDFACLLEGVRIARERPIQEFVASRNGAIMEHIRGAYARQFVPLEMVNASVHGGPPAIAAFKAAVRALFSFDAVLTTERLSKTFPHVVAQFDLAGDGVFLSRENASTVQVPCDRQELREILLQITPMDFCIYAVAQQLETQYL